MMTKTVSITSGKGGVGKTTLTCNLACWLAKQGKRVLIFDGDVGMANVDIMFGTRPDKSLYDVVRGMATLREVLVEVTPKVWLIPGGSGFRNLQNLSPYERSALLEEVSRLDIHFDYLLIDTAPGISDTVLYLNSSCQEKVVIITPEPSSFADSYALIKVLNQDYKEQEFSIVCNLVDDDHHGKFLFKKFSEVAFDFLNVSLDYAGSVPMDSHLRSASHKGRIILKQGVETSASREFIRIGEYLEGLTNNFEMRGGMEIFWNQLVGVA